MSFGNIIKKLRLDNNMTQEQLAEVLSISPQAVSRWETNSALPDISLLPAIANYFDVTTDHLLEVDVSGKEKEIEKLILSAQEYTSRGLWSKGIEILRNALLKYPSAHALSNALAFALYGLPSEVESISPDERQAHFREIVTLEEAVLANSKDTALRYDATQLLCYAYKELNMTDKAEALALTMPHTHQCCENLLVSISDKTNRYRRMQQAFLLHLQQTLLGITCNCAPLDDGNRPYTLEETIVLNKKAIEILNIVFEDGDYGTLHSLYLTQYHLNIASFYARFGNREEVIRYLALAKELAIRNDQAEHNAIQTHTSLIVRGYKYQNIFYGNNENNSLHQLNEMQDGIYDFIREDAEFKSMVEELKMYAATR